MRTEVVLSPGAIVLGFLLMFTVFIAHQFIHRWSGSKKKGIVEGGRLASLENIFVKPFVPTSIPNFIAVIGVVWFALTVPMAATRYYTKKWSFEMLTLQGPLNLISMAFGCKGIDIKSVTYTESLESLDETLPTEYFEMIDSLFTLHLALALVWLAFGGLLIFLAQTGWSKDDDARHKAHRMFGRFVAGPAMIGHVIMTTIVTFKNPVNQSVLIQFMYLNAIYSAFQRTFRGLMYARYVPTRRE